MNLTFMSTLATSFSLVILLPAHSGQIYTISPAAFQTRQHVQLARTVDYLGVPIIDGSKSKLKECSPTSNSVTYGFYSSSRNAMVLCTANAPFESMKQTFVHETMHMVQDCRAGLGNYNLRDKNSYLTKLQYMGLSKLHQRNIRDLYHGQGRAFEVEARKLENSPNIVWKYLVKYCK